MTARKPKRPQVSPRRKAGRKAARRTKRKIAFRLVVEAQEMLVTYTPNWSRGEFGFGHFEFRSPHKPARRIAVSETGYLSHFAAMADIKEFASPKAYAREFVLAHLNAGRKRPPLAAGYVQLSLF